VFAEVHRAAAPSFVVASIPHGGRQWPESAAEDLVVAPESVVSDWHTRELYSFLTDVGVDAVANRSSRFVADPNRDPTTGFGSINNHVVADTDFRGRPLYRRHLTPGDVSARVALAHTPYHEALDLLAGEAVARHGRVLVLDLHCFGADVDADIVIGDRWGTSASNATVAAVEHVLEHQGFRTVRNQRFPGGWIVRRHGRPPVREAIQLELNARTYIDPDTARGVFGLPPYDARFEAVQQRLRSALAALPQLLS
jgi:N-formylglutamate deformylase